MSIGEPTLTMVALQRDNANAADNWVNCVQCEGAGRLWGDIYDDGSASICDDCNGTGGYEFTCDKCGNEVFLSGYDCFACEAVNALPNDNFDLDKIAQGFALELKKWKLI